MSALHPSRAPVFSAPGCWIAERAADPFDSAEARTRAPAVGTIGFLLFIVLNGVLFIRPAEIITELIGLPIYNCIIIVALAAAAPAVIAQLSVRSLKVRPITLCVLGLLPAIIISHLRRANLYDARTDGFEFAKCTAYYLLLVAVVDTPQRLRWFLSSFLVFALAATVLALLHYHDVISIQALEAFQQKLTDPQTEDLTILSRMRGTGIFNDPNDFCLVLVVGIVLCSARLIELCSLPARVLAFGMLAIFLYGMFLTYSRGGLLALVIGMGVLSWSRLGWRKSLALGIPFLLIPTLLLAGRQTDLAAATVEGTGQSRIQLWSEALMLVRESPVFGIGANQFSEEVFHVVHNSFLHALTELGVFGGLLFLGVYFFSLVGLYRIGRVPRRILNREMNDLRAPLFAVTAAYAVGIFALSRCYTVTTYLVPAIVTAYLCIAPVYPQGPILKLNGSLVKRLVIVGVILLTVTYLSVRLLARYAGE
jgi:O-antigen ligase